MLLQIRSVPTVPAIEPRGVQGTAESASTDAVTPKLLVAAYVNYFDRYYFSAFGGKRKLMMKNINFLTLLTFVPIFDVAETEFDYKNSEHKADNGCIGVLSLAAQKSGLSLFDSQTSVHQTYQKKTPSPSFRA